MKKPQRHVRPKQYVWEIIRLKGTPAAYVGRVETTDDDASSAIMEAIERFGITDQWQQERLVARRIK